MRIRQDTFILLYKSTGQTGRGERNEVMAAPSSDGLGRMEEGTCAHYSSNRQVMGPQVLSKHSLCFRENTSRMDFDLDFATCEHL